MNQSKLTNSKVAGELEFHADSVSALEEEFTPDFIVHGIYFGEGDPEKGGQHWNFTRSLGDDDEGVCTVKEIQEVTVYEGIVTFTLTRQYLSCEFDSLTAQETLVRKLKITYEIDDKTWQAVQKQAMHVFEGKSYFTWGQ